MARERSPARAEAKKLYLDSKGKMRLVDIAAKLNIKDTQVRKWKSQDQWEQELKGTLPKSKGNVTNESVTYKEDISWIDVENEYVTDIRKKPCSLEDLSKKYNIPYGTIRDYSTKNSWRTKRDNYHANIMHKTNEKTCELISTDIARYQAKHLNISDKIFNEINKALDNPNELYTVVEKLRQGYGAGEFKESIETEVLEVINESKVVSLVNALDKIQRMQRQTLDITDENKKLQNDKLKAEINRIANRAGSSNDGEIKAMLEGILNEL